MTALLTGEAAVQPEPCRKFDPDRMTRIPDCPSIIDVLRCIKYGGPEWARRHVTLWFPGPSNAWAMVYLFQDGSDPYFDFMYTHKEPPDEVLSALLEKYPQCTVIDWSPGRLACISAPGADIEALVDIIQAVVETVWDEHITVVNASYEEMATA